MVNNKGLSLLEIMIALLLFMVAVAALGMVFTSGYHLNLKNMRQQQAVNLANAILQEVASKPVYAYPQCTCTGSPGDHDPSCGNCTAGTCTAADVTLCPSAPAGCKCPNAGDSLFQIANEWSGTCANAPFDDTHCWTPQALLQLQLYNPSVYNEYKFSIPPEGMQVKFLNPGLDPNHLRGDILYPIGDNPLAQITLILNWLDRQAQGSPRRSITLSTITTHGK